jgi:hypothetical protein
MFIATSFLLWKLNYGSSFILWIYVKGLSWYIIAECFEDEKPLLLNFTYNLHSTPRL